MEAVFVGFWDEEIRAELDGIIRDGLKEPLTEGEGLGLLMLVADDEIELCNKVLDGDRDEDTVLLELGDKTLEEVGEVEVKIEAETLCENGLFDGLKIFDRDGDTIGRL